MCGRLFRLEGWGRANADVHSPSNSTGHLTAPSNGPSRGICRLTTPTACILHLRRIEAGVSGRACLGRYLVECAAAGIAFPAGVVASSALASETKSLK